MFILSGLCYFPLFRLKHVFLMVFRRKPASKPINTYMRVFNPPGEADYSRFYSGELCDPDLGIVFDVFYLILILLFVCA